MSTIQHPPGPPPALRLRDVGRRFGEHRALRDVSFDVPAGSLCGLLGPNGAGKTTTMRILATDLDPTEGEIEVLGLQLPRDADAVRPRIGYMPDNAGLYEELSLSEYLDFFASFYGLSGARRREAVGATMELAGVEPFARRRLAGLSKGERQRVLLARSLIHDPDLLLLDEPADGLDPRGRVELRELLQLLHQRGKTILISSHILSDLEELCTDFVLVDRGKVVSAGSRSRLAGLGAGRAIVRIELVGPAAPLLTRLAQIPQVEVLDSGDRWVEIEMAGPVETAADLLRALVGEGHRIASFARTGDSLEALYLRLTEAP